MNNEIDYDNLDYVVFKSNMEYNFSIEKDPITFLNDIKKGEMSVEEAKDRQKKLSTLFKYYTKRKKKMLNKKNLSKY